MPGLFPALATLIPAQLGIASSEQDACSWEWGEEDGSFFSAPSCLHLFMQVLYFGFCTSSSATGGRKTNQTGT